MKLTIATCQFPINGDIESNLRFIMAQMRQAKRRSAHVAHFAETALPGYAGLDFKSFENYPWEKLRQATQKVQQLARALRMWVILGSCHRLSDGNKPHNSLYVIDDRGRIVDRYDKRYCTGDSHCNNGDLKHYTPGNHTSVFSLRGITCGLQICHDFRYQELYRDSQKHGVRVMFHSFYNGHTTRTILRRSKYIHGIIVPPTMQTYAANNYMWISATNTSMRESSWPGFFVLPDGRITSRLVRNRTGLLINTVDTSQKFYDASGVWRERAMSGILYSGKLVRDPRSANRRTV